MTCVRRRWFFAPREACREMPVLAASEMIATSFEPSLKAAFSRKFTPSTSPSLAIEPGAAASRPRAPRESPRASYRSTPEEPPSPGARTMRPRRPVISATADAPPSSSMSSSRKFTGRSSSRTCLSKIAFASAHSSFTASVAPAAERAATLKRDGARESWTFA